MSHTGQGTAPGQGYIWNGTTWVFTNVLSGVEDEGVLLPAEPRINFTGGGVTVVDDPGNNRVNVVVPVGAGGGWADDGAVVRLVTSADQVSIGALTPFGAEKVRITGAAQALRAEGAVSLLGGADTDLYLEMGDGDNAAVSAASTGRIRYNATAQTFQVSENGGAWTDLSVGGNAFVQGGNSFGAPAVLGTNDNFDLTFERNNIVTAAVDIYGLNGNPAGGRATIGPRVGAGAHGAVYLAVAVPDANNWALMSTGGFTFVSDPLGTGAVILASANSVYNVVAWQGPVTIGQFAGNQTQALAAAGLTGPMVNVSPATGAVTTAASQAVQYNVGGTHHIQGHLSASLEVAAGIMMVEAADLGANREVVSLCRGSLITTTQMPANTGDRVVYLANATTNPTATPVDGGVLYESAGSFNHKGTAGTVTTMAAA